MAFQFSKVEQLELSVAWLAWKDIESKDFIDTFKPIWDETILDVSKLLTDSVSKIKLEEIKKVGLTLQPNIGFAYTPLKHEFFINVWSFFFCLADESHIFFRPSFLLANEFVHEYSHFLFYQDHNMLDREHSVLEEFKRKYGLEEEKYALTEEANFLKKVRYVVPNRVRMKVFHVISWTSDGMLNYEAWLDRLETRKSINLTIRGIEKAIKTLSSIDSYDDNRVRQTTGEHETFSTILKLPISREYYPIVELDI